MAALQQKGATQPMSQDKYLAKDLEKNLPCPIFRLVLKPPGTPGSETTTIDKSCIASAALLV